MGNPSPLVREKESLRRLLFLLCGNLLGMSNSLDPANAARLREYTISASKFQESFLRIAQVRGLSKEEAIATAPVEHRRKLRRLLWADHGGQQTVDKPWAEMVIRRVAGVAYRPTPSEAASFFKKRDTEISA